MEYATLNNGATIPLLGFGTWKSAPGEVKGAVKEAIQIGYRHIDCASIYGNEDEVGDAIQECIESGICKREDLFITSKLFNDKHNPEDVMPQLEASLKSLKVDYLDMYLIHWPVVQSALKEGISGELIALEKVPIISTWEAMEKCVEAGKTKGIGVSNFSIKKLEDLLSKCQKIQPAINQVERHPYLAQTALLEYCKSKGIHVTGYSGLGSSDRPEGLKAPNEPVLLEDPVIHDIAKKANASPAQVLLKWAIQSGGASTIPKSVKPHRILENFQSLQVQLSEDDMAMIAKLDKHRRYVDGTFWCTPGSPYTLENLWDE